MRDSNGGIDVRLNGACIVLGLLYGEGDLDKSMALSMRCGWDSDCNPSNVGGILMAACGFKALPAKYVEKLDYEVVDKREATLPDELRDIVRCNNPKCISNNEPMSTHFHVVQHDPLVLRCHYCERKVDYNEITLK